MAASRSSAAAALVGRLVSGDRREQPRHLRVGAVLRPAQDDAGAELLGGVLGAAGAQRQRRRDGPDHGDDRHVGRRHRRLRAPASSRVAAASRSPSSIATMRLRARRRTRAAWPWSGRCGPSRSSRRCGVGDQLAQLVEVAREPGDPGQRGADEHALVAAQVGVLDGAQRAARARRSKSPRRTRTSASRSHSIAVPLDSVQRVEQLRRPRRARSRRRRGRRRASARRRATRASSPSAHESPSSRKPSAARSRSARMCAWSPMVLGQVGAHQQRRRRASTGRGARASRPAALLGELVVAREQREDRRARARAAGGRRPRARAARRTRGDRLARSVALADARSRRPFGDQQVDRVGLARRRRARTRPTSAPRPARRSASRTTAARPRAAARRAAVAGVAEPAQRGDHVVVLGLQPRVGLALLVAAQLGLGVARPARRSSARARCGWLRARPPRRASRARTRGSSRASGSAVPARPAAASGRRARDSRARRGRRPPRRRSPRSRPR